METLGIKPGASGVEALLLTRVISPAPDWIVRNKTQKSEHISRMKETSWRMLCVCPSHILGAGSHFAALANLELGILLAPLALAKPFPYLTQPWVPERGPWLCDLLTLCFYTLNFILAALT